ncbi:hypothetical protein ACFYZB_20210 [Streptomyces sp. NPDC001852]|uniref:hypothetical protein n=1 Tax=Streptomyces sp. NPDC001852 TaxID=3364619 RepID=UPI00369ACC58
MTVLGLHRDITARGFRGHYSTVRDWVRRDLPRPEGFTRALPPPSVRQVTGWLTRHPATLTVEEKLHLNAVLDRCPELTSAAELTSSFAEMLITLSGTRLPSGSPRPRRPTSRASAALPSACTATSTP